MMTPEYEYVKRLLRKHLDRSASPSEISLLLIFLKLYPEAKIDKMMDEIEPDIDFGRFRNDAWKIPTLKKIKSRKAKVPLNESVFKRAVIRYAAVCAGLIILAGVSIWLGHYRPRLEYRCADATATGDIPTGKYSCKLTLGNGCTILIDSTYSGFIVKQGSVEIRKSDQGVLMYIDKGSADGDISLNSVFNTITLLQGSQYRVTLTDGTSVRLNTGSSLTFPVKFDHEVRVVELEGEGYFDVSHKQKVPFVVKIKNGHIQATGTRFNVNAYAENTITTLLSGAIEVKSKRNDVFMKPQQQSIIYGCKTCPSLIDSIFTFNGVDTAQAMAWMSRERVYANIRLSDLVNEIGRWYDLDIVNLEHVPQTFYSVRICYNAPLEAVLNMLRGTGLKFRYDGRKIIIFS